MTSHDDIAYHAVNNWMLSSSKYTLGIPTYIRESVDSLKCELAPGLLQCRRSQDLNLILWLTWPFVCMFPGNREIHLMAVSLQRSGDWWDGAIFGFNSTRTIEWYVYIAYSCSENRELTCKNTCTLSHRM